MTEVQQPYLESEVLSDIDDNDSLADTLPDNEAPSIERETRQASQQSVDSSRASLAVQAAKAIDAAQDRIPSPDQVLRDVSANEQQALHLRREHEETPLLDAGPAPPDYAAATAWRRGQPTIPGDRHASIETTPHIQPPHRYQQDRDDIEQASQATRTRIERYQDDIEHGPASQPSQHHNSSEDIRKDNASVLLSILTTLFRLVFRALGLLYQTLRYCLPKLCRGAYIALKWCFETRTKAIVTIVVVALVIILPILFEETA